MTVAELKECQIEGYQYQETRMIHPTIEDANLLAGAS